MSNQPDITIIIPCHIPDNRVEKAIASSQWAKEIFVLDQNSQQNWENLSKKYNFTLFSQDKLTHFSDMRNKMMQRVETEWIFFLDSDEFIPLPLVSELEEKIQAKYNVSAYKVKRQDFFLGKNVFHGEVGSKLILRIVKKGFGKWQGRVHEVLVVKDQNSIGVLKHSIIHESHLNTHDFITKINFYTTLLAEERYENQTILKTIALPFGKFIYTYIIKYGFLDGFRGLIYSFCMSVHSLTVRIKRYETHK